MMKVALKAFGEKKAEWKEREKETRDSVQGALGDFFVKGNRLRHARVFSNVESQSNCVLTNGLMNLHSFLLCLCVSLPE